MRKLLHRSRLLLSLMASAMRLWLVMLLMSSIKKRP